MGLERFKERAVSKNEPVSAIFENTSNLLGGPFFIIPKNEIVLLLFDRII